jgi:hypothetical protein
MCIGKSVFEGFDRRLADDSVAQYPDPLWVSHLRRSANSRYDGFTNEWALELQFGFRARDTDNSHSELPQLGLMGLQESVTPRRLFH